MPVILIDTGCIARTVSGKPTVTGQILSYGLLRKWMAEAECNVTNSLSVRVTDPGPRRWGPLAT